MKDSSYIILLWLEKMYRIFHYDDISVTTAELFKKDSRINRSTFSKRASQSILHAIPKL